MKNSSLSKIFTMAVVISMICAVAEAGTSAARTYKLSVTIPATFQNSARQDSSLQVKKNNGQTTMERVLRDNKMVAIKTVVPK